MPTLSWVEFTQRSAEDASESNKTMLINQISGKHKGKSPNSYTHYFQNLDLRKIRRASTKPDLLSSEVTVKRLS